MSALNLSQDAIEALNHCNKCGFCLAACPTYAVSFDERHSPRGRLSLVEAAWRGEIAPEAGLVDALSACLGCRACEVACPSGVRYGRVLEAARADLYRRHRRYTVRTPVTAGLLEAVRRPSLMHTLVRLGRIGRRLPLPARLRALTEGLPEQEGETPAKAPAPGPAAGPPVLFFESCVMRAAYPETNRHAATLLTAGGARLVEGVGEHCCGALHLHSGDLEGARALARANLRRWRDFSPDTIIVGHAGGCLAMLSEYGELLRDDPEWADTARAIASRVRDFAKALAHLPRRPHFVGHGERVALQNSCHLVNVLGQGDWPVRWLQAIPGDTYVALAGQDRCCGSAGVYNINEPERAAAILAGHLDEVERVAPDRWIVNNPGCGLWCQSGVHTRALGVKVTQFADYLYQAWDGTTTAAPHEVEFRDMG